MNADYRRSIDSNAGVQPLAYSGYLPLVFLRRSKTNDGVAIGWDYLGHWQLILADRELRSNWRDTKKDLAPASKWKHRKHSSHRSPGESMSLGTNLLDWQYQYLWDYTNPDYFGKDALGGRLAGSLGGRRWYAQRRQLGTAARPRSSLRSTSCARPAPTFYGMTRGGTTSGVQWAAPDWKLTTDYFAQGTI